MGFFSKLFGPRKSPGEKVSDELATQMVEMIWGGVMEIKNQWPTDNTVALYHVMIALKCFSILRASTSGKLKTIDLNMGKMLAESFLRKSMPAIPKTAQDEGVIRKFIQHIADTWDNHVEDEPSPHWYVGVECAQYVYGSTRADIAMQFAQCMNIMTVETAKMFMRLEEVLPPRDLAPFHQGSPQGPPTAKTSQSASEPGGITRKELLDGFFSNLPKPGTKMHHQLFIKMCVDKVAIDQARAIVRHVDGAVDAFEGKAKALVAEAGAMIIEGYIAARIAYRTLHGVHPLYELPPDEQIRKMEKALACWQNMKVDIPDVLDAFFSDLARTRIQQNPLFSPVIDKNELMMRFALLYLNGAMWAKAEMAVFG